MGEETFKHLDKKNESQEDDASVYDDEAIKQENIQLNIQEASSIKQDEKKSAEILQEIESLDGSSMNSQDERDVAKKKLSLLGEKFQQLDDAEDVVRAADKRVVRHEPNGLAAKATEQKLRTSHLEEDFDTVDTNLALFSVLDTFLPNWESAIGGDKSANEKDSRSTAVQECAEAILNAVGEIELRENNQSIFNRAIEALGIMLGGDGRALRNQFFDEAGRPNISMIKKFAAANKELLTNSSIPISSETITPLETKE